MLLIGVSFAAAQDRDSRWDNRAVYQNAQWGYGNNNNGDYQRGVQDGINSGRADAQQGKVANLGSHPYYRNSNNQAYREGFSQGYREAYGQMRGGNNGYYGNGRNNGSYGNNGYYGNNGSYNNGHNQNGYYDQNGHWHRYKDHDHDRDDRDRDRDRDHDHDRDDH
jgi:hypothetical protein